MKKKEDENIKNFTQNINSQEIERCKLEHEVVILYQILYEKYYKNKNKNNKSKNKQFNERIN